MLKPDEREHNESAIRSLFQTMRETDAQRAPSFVQVTQAQSLRAMSSRDRLGYLRAVTVAAVAVVLFAVVAVNALRHKEVTRVANTPTNAVTVAVVPQTTTLAPTRAKPARVGHPLHATQPAKAVPSISTWKSPTEALLKTPGDDLRTTLPRIGFTQSKPSSAE